MPVGRRRRSRTARAAEGTRPSASGFSFDTNEVDIPSEDALDDSGAPADLEGLR